MSQQSLVIRKRGNMGRTKGPVKNQILTIATGKSLLHIIRNSKLRIKGFACQRTNSFQVLLLVLGFVLLFPVEIHTYTQQIPDRTYRHRKCRHLP